MQSKRQIGFTLVELLVVIAIIGLLVSILLPAFGRSREAAKRVVCRTRLHGVAVTLRAYLNDSDDIMPIAARMPTINTGLPRFADVMKRYIDGSEKSLRCPSDIRRHPDYPDTDTYYESEGSSYEYNQSLGGREVDESFLSERFGWNEAQIPVMYDYDMFHGREENPKNRNYLFGDGHVGFLVE